VMSEPPSELRPLVDDSEGVVDSDTLLRIVTPFCFNGDNRNSNAFEDQRLERAQEAGLAGPCSSVNVRRIWEASGAGVDVLLADFAAGSGIVEIPVGALRDLRTLNGDPVPQGVMLDPRDGRPWHAVTFSLGGGKKSKGAKRAIDEIATWFWHPDQAN
jgi:hypothetical protein